MTKIKNDIIQGITNMFDWIINIAIRPKTAEIEYKIKTAFGVEIPRLTNWWWMCNKSGLKIFFLKIIRLKTLNVRSINGNAKINPNIIKDIVDFITPITDITAKK